MTDSVLKVELSFNQTRWIMHDADPDLVARVARTHDLPEIAARLLVARGIDQDHIAEFLNPTLRDHFPDPLSLAGMTACAAYLAEAIIRQKNIAVFGDFDVDGATSAAVLHRFLKHCGIEAPVYIPDRLTEGYGPNVPAFQALKEQGCEVLIVLDCGTTAFDIIKAGQDMGLEIVILDHHEPEERLPDALHVINPKRTDDTSGLDMLAAVGVTFMTCVAINSKLREKGFYQARAEPALKENLDIVALGTVCDMVPLTGINRLIVRQGFSRMAYTDNIGLKALMDVSGLSGDINTYHAGFVLGPRINAGSRVYKSNLGARLLCSDNLEEAQNIAWTLNDCNEKRKALQAEMENAALAQVETQGLNQNSVIIVDGEGWHTGLSGLVAGRLKDKYKKPACVIAYVKRGDGTVEGRGSGRSMPGIHIAQAFIEAKEAGLLEKGGGHAMAGGFTCRPDQVLAFKDFMSQNIAAQAQNTNVAIDQTIDGVLTVRGAQVDLLHTLNTYIGPFGQGHSEPLWVFENIRVWSADIVGGAHIRTMISDWEGGPRLKAMAFRAVDTPLGDALLKSNRRSFHLAGLLKLDNWGGTERVEMHIRDGAFAS